MCKIQDVLEIECVALPSSIYFPIYYCCIQYLFGSYSVLVQGVNDPWHKYEGVERGSKHLPHTHSLSLVPCSPGIDH